MPVLGKKYTKKLELPGYPEDDKAYVTIVTNPKAEVWENIDTGDAMTSQYLVLSRIIVEWNFVDELGQPQPITPETVKSALSILDVALIQEHLGISGLADSKKNS